MRFILLICSALVAGLLPARGQDPNFTQFYILDMNINPAFSGASPHYRLSTLYRNQWMAAGSPYQIMGAAFDYNFDLTNTGLGAQVLRSTVGDLGLESTSAAINASVAIQPTKTVNFRAGLGMTYHNQRLDPSNLLFQDQILSGSPTLENLPSSSTNYLSISSGLLLYNQFFWAGIGIYHLNQPDQGITREEKLNRRFTLHAGTKIPIRNTPRSKAKYYLMPAALFQAQGAAAQLDLGANLLYKKMLAGLWYRGIPTGSGAGDIINQDALALQFGYQYRYVRIGYSFDFTISGLGIGGGGTHEITFVISPTQDRRYKGGDKWRKRIECPAFSPNDF